MDDLRSDNKDNQDDSYQFSFEDEDEDEIGREEEVAGLDVELCGSEIQKAAARILISSIENGVSDIHIEAQEETYKIRMRRDGVMQDYASIPHSTGIKLVACYKNMAEMDISERREQQDGKIKRMHGERFIELRCSTMAAQHGEKLVIHIMNTGHNALPLEALIYNEETRKKIRDLISGNKGYVVFTGPTGSGKSTTIASALRERDNGEMTIVTAEDPIGINLGGNIQQFPVIRAKGQTFENALQGILRQDPDIILIEETCDPETANSCIDAAATGRLVVSSMHETSTSQCLSTLMNMGLANYKLNSNLRGLSLKAA